METIQSFKSSSHLSVHHYTVHGNTMMDLSASTIEVLVLTCTVLNVATNVAEIIKKWLAILFLRVHLISLRV